MRSLGVQDWTDARKVHAEHDTVVALHYSVSASQVKSRYANACTGTGSDDDSTFASFSTCASAEANYHYTSRSSRDVWRKPLVRDVRCETGEQETQIFCERVGCICLPTMYMLRTYMICALPFCLRLFY